MFNADPDATGNSLQLLKFLILIHLLHIEIKMKNRNQMKYSLNKCLMTIIKSINSINQG